MEWWKTIKRTPIQKIEKCVAQYRMDCLGTSELDFPYYDIKTYEDQDGRFRARTDACYRRKSDGSTVVFDVDNMETEEDAVKQLLSIMLEFGKDPSFDEYELEFLPHYRF
ncbi:MAG: hypothetical protein IKX88_01115 [Thermoguttaceae bacterium]|nr:hypothetical protein [Thermoguttaceae bacterium]